MRKTAASANNTVVATSSPSSDDYSKPVLIGFFAVVVSILLWLGIRSDLERDRWGQGSPEWQYQDQAMSSSNEDWVYYSAADLSFNPGSVS